MYKTCGVIGYLSIALIIINLGVIVAAMSGSPPPCSGKVIYVL